MKAKKIILSVAFFIILFNVMPIFSFANSSWVWISSARPFDLLPVVIVITLAIEVASINYLGKVRNLKLVIPVVAIANIVSFLFPYIWLTLDHNNLYSCYGLGKDFFTSIDYNVSNQPTYTVTVFYLVLTLIIEIPIVYLFLRKKTENKKRLIAVIVAANVITTAITFGVERIFCHGRW